MRKKLLQTENDYAALVLRVMLGVVFFPHGAQKVLGWFGGYGFAGTYDAFTNKMGIPGIFALLAFAASDLDWVDIEEALKANPGEAEGLAAYLFPGASPIDFAAPGAAQDPGGERSARALCSGLLGSP